MEFELKVNYVECRSDSGSLYKLTKWACNCKGYSFRRDCRHMREALAKDLFTQLEAQRSESTSLFLTSDYITNERLKSIRYGLKKYKIPFTENLILRLNKVMRADGDLKKFLTLARRG